MFGVMGNSCKCNGITITYKITYLTFRPISLSFQDTKTRSIFFPAIGTFP